MSLHNVNFDQILALDEQRAALLAALTCEKICPNYSQFNRTAKWGNAEDLAKAVEFLYAAATTGKWSRKVAREVRIKVEESIPDIDNFMEYSSASYAFDASLAIDAALSFLATDDKQHVIDCVTHALNTVDMFVQELDDLDPNQPDLNQIIDNSQHLQRESQRQQGLLALLVKTQAITPEFISMLRQEQKLTEPMINLDLLPA